MTPSEVLECRLSLRESSVLAFFRGAKGDYENPHDANVFRASVFGSRLLLFGLGVAVRGTAVPDANSRFSAAIAKIAEAR